MADLPKPKNRKESYLAKAAGVDTKLPADGPKSREEQYLNAIAENGDGGGGGGTSDFDELSNRPKYNGATMTGETDIPELKDYTAGENVQISDDGRISATDTTYSAFTGTDGETAGTTGLVPAPAVDDNGKFLKSDGTWGEVSGGQSVLYDDIGTSTDGAMTQKAVTEKVLGMARALTEDDYNWPTAAPNSVAVWLLEPGVYANPGALTVWLDSSTFAPTNRVFIVSPRDGGSILYVALAPDLSDRMRLYNVSSTGAPMAQIGFNPKNNLTTGTPGSYFLDAYQGKVLKDLIDSLVVSGTGAPTAATVGTVGKLYEDTTNGKLYQCTAADTTTSAYTWEEVGSSGSSVNAVQTPGMSETDVMSQKAASQLVYPYPNNLQNVAIGADVQSGPAGRQTTVVGAFSEALYTGGVALGAHASATGGCAIALGGGANAYRTGQMDISTGTAFPTSGFNGSNYRLLTGLYDPLSDHDAATKGYVDSVAGGSIKEYSWEDIQSQGYEYLLVWAKDNLEVGDNVKIIQPLNNPQIPLTKDGMGKVYYAGADYTSREPYPEFTLSCMWSGPYQKGFTVGNSSDNLVKTYRVSKEDGFVSSGSVLNNAVDSDNIVDYQTYGDEWSSAKKVLSDSALPTLMTIVSAMTNFQGGSEGISPVFPSDPSLEFVRWKASDDRRFGSFVPNDDFDYFNMPITTTQSGGVWVYFETADCIPIQQSKPTDGSFNVMLHVGEYPNEQKWYNLPSHRYQFDGTIGQWHETEYDFTEIKVGYAYQVVKVSDSVIAFSGSSLSLDGFEQRTVGGSLSDLETTDKSSLVAAINELNSRLSALES